MLIKDRATRSENTYRYAKELACHNGLALTNPSEGCYQLRHSVEDWIINLYPRRKGHTPRVYHDPNHRGPHLNMPTQWTLLDAVNAAIMEVSKCSVKNS